MHVRPGQAAHLRCGAEFVPVAILAIYRLTSGALAADVVVTAARAGWPLGDRERVPFGALVIA